MYYKGIILEVKDKYCLAMDDGGAVYRIAKKKNVNVGDKIYFLDEDVVKGESIMGNKSGEKGGGILKSGKMRKIIAVAAAIAIFIGSFGIVKYNNVAYAALSMDAEQSVQLQLNRDGEVVGVSSFGKQLSEEEMDKYKGLTMEQFWQIFAEDNKDTKEPFMIGYVAMKGGSETEAQVEKDINKYMVGRNIVILKGDKADIDGANKENMSIGEYILSTYDDNDELEDFLEESSRAGVEKFLLAHQDKISSEEAQKILMLKDKIDREEMNDDNDIDDDDDDDYDKDDDVDDDDDGDYDDDDNDYDDDDDDDYVSNKPSKPSKPSKPAKPSKPVNNPNYDDDDDDDDYDDDNDIDDEEDDD